VEFLMMRKKDGRFPKYSGNQLATAIGENVEAPSVTSAIMEFRNKCSEKLGCGKHDVIAFPLRTRQHWKRLPSPTA
jgi:hypothetical protein